MAGAAHHELRCPVGMECRGVRAGGRPRPTVVEWHDPFRLSFLYVDPAAELNEAQQSRVGDRCHSRVELTRTSARIPTRNQRAQQPEQSPGPKEPASCARPKHAKIINAPIADAAFDCPSLTCIASGCLYRDG